MLVGIGRRGYVACAGEIDNELKALGESGVWDEVSLHNVASIIASHVSNEFHEFQEAYRRNFGGPSDKASVNAAFSKSGNGTAGDQFDGHAERGPY